MKEHIIGGLLGFAVGDALGGVTEFLSEEEIAERYGKVTEFIGGGCWNLEPGETTDDTAMTVAVAKGILADPENPIEHIGKEFLKWYESDPKDVGVTILNTFDNYEGDWFEAAKKTHDDLHGQSAGNGSLMRCLPITLLYADQEKMEEVTILQSKMTHYDDVAAEACVIYNRIAKRLLEEREELQEDGLRKVIEQEITNTIYESILHNPPQCPPDGYVVHTMSWVLHWLLTCNKYEDVVIGATNMGGDSDTIAAIAGGLKGLEWQPPIKYREGVQGADFLNLLGVILYVTRIRRQGLLNDYEMSQFLKEIKSSYQLLSNVFERHRGEREKINYSLVTHWHEVFGIAVKIIGESINKQDPYSEPKTHAYLKLENRFRRTARLIEMTAPEIIIEHEMTWVLLYIEHFDKWLHGVEAKYTKYQQEHLDFLHESQEEERRYWEESERLLDEEEDNNGPWD